VCLRAHLVAEVTKVRKVIFVALTLFFFLTPVARNGLRKPHELRANTGLAPNGPSPADGSVQLVDRFPGGDASAKIVACIAALPPTGGTCDARGLQGPQKISSNIFAAVTKPGRLIFGAATYVVTGQVEIPSNWDVGGIGATTVLQGAIGLPGNPAAIIVNSNYASCASTCTHNTNISLHDLTLDGNRSGTGLVTSLALFRGIDDSSFYNLNLRNFALAAIDIRDGSNNSIHDNSADATQMRGVYHAFGGGTAIASGVFRNNKFTKNSATGGSEASDHFDINGDTSKVAEGCSGNEFTDNTSDQAKVAGIFLDGCAKNTVTRNIVRTPVVAGIATSSGPQLAKGNTITYNTVARPGQWGILLKSVSQNNLVSHNTVELSGQEGILVQDSMGNTIQANVISGPGQSLPARSFPGIHVQELTENYCARNTVEGNKIEDKNGKMTVGILIDSGHKTSGPNQNVIKGNQIRGGSAGKGGGGIEDHGRGTQAQANQWQP
jgi:parallel beta-helix repeat protein